MDCLQKRCWDVLPSTSAMGESQKLTKKKAENRGESWSFHSTYKIIGGIHQFWRIHGTIVYLLTYYPKNSTKCIGTYNNKYTIHGSYENRFCHPTIQLHIAPQMMKNTLSSEQDRFYALERFGKFQEILEPGFFTQTPVAVDGRSPKITWGWCDDVLGNLQGLRIVFFNLRCLGDWRSMSIWYFNKLLLRICLVIVHLALSYIQKCSN